MKLTRSHKFGDREYQARDADTDVGLPSPGLHRFFVKHGPTNADPTKTKKNGGGKGNWGPPGAEIEDADIEIHHTKPRRRSNSSTHLKTSGSFKTKFETIEPEPVFEMSEHGPLDDDSEKLSLAQSESNAGSVQEEDMDKH
ncbi:hypothetical protein EJ06DRAFT_549807 [Trichodelitschia bisporula]|uniref:Hyaluronan/mRNA-binding protein domain-containing protein n=1 Tax=Trichodelitschia bisporula TaxID=703511 RepID=A0A6G1HSU1_9PEZI|nr:hypothetical protein EJ06DRAFT_549807 [Trichodelitschia bisporula]